MMDQGILAAVEAAFHFGFPLDAEAILLIEVDGLEAGLDAQRERIVELCTQVRRPRGAPGPRRQGAAAAVEVPQAGLRRRRPAEPQLLHAGRRRAAHQAAAHPAAHHRDRREARRADRQRVPRRRRQHPSDPAVRRARPRSRSSRVLAASGEILDECIACGGSVTGEHGIGVEKIGFMHKLFTTDDLAAMAPLARGVQSRRPPEPRQDAADRRRMRPGAEAPRPPCGAVISGRWTVTGGQWSECQTV